MTRSQWLKYGIVACFFAAASVLAQSTAVRTDSDAPALISKAPASANLLRALDSSLEAVISKVSPAVVQIVVNGYIPSEDHGQTTARVVRQRAIGTGIIVDPDGYIITNAHVVEGAQRMRVILPPPTAESSPELQPIHADHILDATVLVTQTIGFGASQGGGVPVRQGELVFAIGSPEGLRIRQRWGSSAQSPGNSIQITSWCVSRLTRRSIRETVGTSCPYRLKHEDAPWNCFVACPGQAL